MTIATGVPGLISHCWDVVCAGVAGFCFVSMGPFFIERGLLQGADAHRRSEFAGVQRYSMRALLGKWSLGETWIL